MVNRRRVIKTVGSLGTMSVVGTASASKKGEKIPAAEVGLDEEIARLLRENKTEKARIILENNNIKYSISSSQRRNNTRSGYTTADYYDKGDSTVYASLVHREDDRWLATGVADLNWGEKSWTKSANTMNDGFSLGWDNSHWTSPDRTRDNIWYGVYKKEEVPGNPDVIASIDEYTRHGIGGEVELDGKQVEPKYPNFSLNLQTDILRTDPHPEVGFTFRYKHSFAAIGLSSSISFSYGPGVVMKVPRLADSWMLEESVDP
ncbi:hypothetical protein [Natrinema halophilum]|uniref:Uncharacterized protein n=1 Tax=Natrinema halophilum TaxID=1699371 RepID=A0A7D5GJZ3_9EURY|nr:hypothetical protein [Natrinema halophilum]QLG48830.1 hypothetical protein HYG82_08200 [Natrinema halophilum]